MSTWNPNGRNTAQLAYEAYAASTGGKTYDGRPMPTWAQICERTPHVALAWEAAASAVAVETSIATRVLRSTQHAIKGGLNFGEALFALRTGSRVARAGWNGKAMWIALTPGTFIAKELARAGAARHLRNELEAAGGTDMRICAHIDMRAADGSLVVGWLASQTDMLAEDWCVVEDAKAEHHAFTCPQCGGHEWGTEIGVPGVGDVGHCHGYAGTQRCVFTWNRKDDATYLKPELGAAVDGVATTAGA